MSKYKKVDIKERNISFTKEIEKILSDYGEEANNVLVDCAIKSGDNAKKMLIGNSAKKTGKYAKGWRKNTERKRYSTEVIVYDSTKPTLTWLLENGHALVRGGRVVGQVDGDGVIFDVNEYISGYYYDDVMRNLQ